MAAESKQKKLITANRNIMKNHYMAVGIVNLIYLIYAGLYYTEFSTWNWIGLTTLLLGYFLCFRSLESYCKPSEYVTMEGHKSFSVNDLSKVSGSLIEYTFDIIYIECVIQIGSIISSYFWLLLLVIPGFAIYKLYFSIIQPYLSSRDIMSQMQNNNAMMGQNESNVSDKKKKKMERQEKRNQQQMQRMRIRPAGAGGDEDDE